MKYEEYMQEQKEKKNLPGVCFKKPKKILKKRDHVPSQIALNEATTVLVNAKFVMEPFSRSLGWFNENAQKLLELHLASSFKVSYLVRRQYSQNEPSSWLWVRADLARNGIFDYEKLKKTWNMRMVDQSEKCKESVMESKKEEEAIELKVKKARFCFCKKQRKDCGRKITVSPTTLV
ncbi:PREDICTED: E3 ubiquitin-protein ligase BAH1-like [Brassica oleracea var. oleracea]|uniref:E3 ubiquitin-protein ligase BAH1-like n=1 Tax=Brassica oleracea var. oleracea TaxID=109376 RepID=UPI0006A6A2AD|nr:PREDICTED: E3 ubiquitin-protein ligase BAH1-like [Brassica oleracea var. oleracea]